MQSQAKDTTEAIGQGDNSGDNDPSGAAGNRTQRVAICVCTRGRPRMLAACLNSLARQKAPHWLDPFIVVVDNNPDGSANPIVRQAPVAALFALCYRHEPRPGIAIARNAALDEARARGAQWIAFLDDDETAADDWLAALMAPEYLDVPVLLGRQIFVYPEPRPFWALPDKPYERPEGQRMKTAYTNNVRFNVSLPRAGLTFNEGLGGMGGEDNEFFAAAHALGFEIRRTRRAITYETAHPERLTYRGQVYRAYWNAASEMRRLAVLRGWPRVLALKSHTGPLHLVFGAAELAAAPLFLIGGLTLFKRRALAGGKKMAKGTGRLAAMLAAAKVIRWPQPYRQPAGQ